MTRKEYQAIYSHLTNNILRVKKIIDFLKCGSQNLVIKNKLLNVDDSRPIMKTVKGRDFNTFVPESS